MRFYRLLGLLTRCARIVEVKTSRSQTQKTVENIAGVSIAMLKHHLRAD